MEDWFDFDVPKNWKRAGVEGWSLNPNFYIRDTKKLNRESQLSVASLFGFAHVSELTNLLPKRYDSDEVFSHYFWEACRTFDLSDDGVHNNRDDDRYRVQVRNPAKDPNHSNFFIYRRLPDSTLVFVDFFYNVSTKKPMFVPTATMGGENVFSIRYPDKVTFDDAVKLVDTIQSFSDFKVEQQKFDARFSKHSTTTLTRESLESLVQGISGKVDMTFITQLESTIHGLTGVDTDLNPYSRNVASRVFFPGGSAVFKISKDAVSAEREVALINAAQLDPYLAPFIPKLLDNNLYEYNGSSMFIMQDRRYISEVIPSFVADHFSYVNNHNPSLKVKLSSSSDFKTYLTALFHWRGRELKDSLPQVLFTSSYLSFPQIESRLVGFDDSDLQSQLNYLSGVYPEAVDLLEHTSYTTLLHRDMKPENIVFNQNKKAGLIPMSIVDFGDASTGPGIFDMARHFNDTLSSSLSFLDYNTLVQRQAKLYLAFMNSFSNLGTVDSSEFNSTMNLFRACAAVDYSKFGSWCISHGVHESSSKNIALAQSALRLAYHNAKDLSSHL